MKKVFFVVAIVATVCLTACGDGAVKVNDTIVAGLDGTIEKFDKVTSLIQDDAYDAASAQLDSALAFVKNSREKIEKLETTSGAEFKTAAIDYLNLVETEGYSAYKEAIELFKTEQEEQFEKANNLLNSFIDKTQTIHAGVQAKQAEFAAKNNVQLH